MAADPSLEAIAGGDFFGMYMSVVCSDYGQHESLAEALASDATVRPPLQSRDMVEQTFAECDARR